MQTLVIKISGEYFKTDEWGLVSENKAKVFSDALKQIIGLFSRIYIIVGGGNFIRGRQYIKNIVPRHIYDEIGMNLTNANAQWLSWFLKMSGHSSIALTTGINSFLKNFSQHLTSVDFHKSPNQPKIIVIGGGTSMPYLSTDTLTIITALRVKAPLVLFAKHGIDGVYTNNPITNKNAKFIKSIKFREIINKKLEFIDLSAIAIALNKQLALKIFKFQSKDDLIDVINNKLKHTYID